MKDVAAKRGKGVVTTAGNFYDFDVTVEKPGKGVKLDTPEVPIFWYKPTDSEKYQVLYADLSVKEVSKDELPEAEPRP